MIMKSQENFLQIIKQHGRRIATISFLAGVLLLPWRTAEAEQLSFVEFECVGYSVLSVNVAADGYPQGVARILCRMSVYSLETNIDTPNFLHHPPANFTNTYNPGSTLDEAGFLPVLSW
jgi:hypothetical protein